MIPSATPQEIELLTNLLRSGNAARIGETAVVSTCIHTIDQIFDGTVYINVEIDAGQFFYKRKQRGEIVHLDIFHEIGNLSHRKVFKSIVNEINRYKKLYNINENNLLTQINIADFVDVQTATGGGRITGKGRHGRKLSVRKNHKNHCHVTLKLNCNDYRLLFYVVDAVEQVILNQQLKLQKINRLVTDKSSIVKNIFEEFEKSSDSFLVDEESKKKNVAKGINYHSDIIASIQEHVLVSAEWEWLATEAFDLEVYYDIPMSLDERLEANKKLRRKNKKYTYESEMTGSKKIFSSNRNTIKQYSDYTLTNSSNNYTKAFRSRRTKLSNDGGSLAIASTVKKALLSRHYKHDYDKTLRFTKADLCYYQKPHQSYRNFLFLIDCSASMKGARIHAASVLVDRLLSWSRDKVAIISIQEDNVYLKCPFTRNRQKIQETLANLRPYGLTPLAEGIELAYQYIIRNNYYNAEVVLISDGIPTVSRYGNDPVSEAETAAALLASSQVKFLCIGIQPNSHIMNRIASAGQGLLYITKDLRTDILLRIFRREHDGIRQA